MASLLDLLADGSHPRARVTFVGRGDEQRLTFEDVWRSSDGASAWLAQRTGPGDTIAAVLSSTPECLAVVVGAWRAGLRVASLPDRSRAMSAAEYQAQIAQLCRLVEADWVFAHERLDLLNHSTNSEPFATVHADKPPSDRDGARFVQFSSGSTGQPKGIELELEAVAENIAAILTTLGPPDDVATCSWLPLSHDMGLIGACLGTWAGSGPRWAGRGHLVAIAPDKFIANPMCWLSLASAEHSHITVAPNFALDLLARRLDGLQTSLDLSCLEVCIVGAEPVRAATLERFAEVTAPFGFDPVAFCPSYGMAEASLAITLTPPDEQWRCLRLDRARLDVGDLAIADDGQPFVSVGRAVPGMEVRIAGERSIGPIEMRSGSLLSRYVGSEALLPLTSDGWFRSKDLGFFHDGELFITGRTDDVMFIAGRNVYVTELEQSIGQVEGIRGDHCAVVADDDGGYRIVAERRRGTRFKGRLPETCREVRLVSARLWGASPREVLLVAPGTFPKTPSGKLQRSRLRNAIESGELVVDARQAFGSR